MTDIEKFNLLWLCHAMTAPLISEEKYYYDALTQKFFYTRVFPTIPDKLQLFSSIDLYLLENERKDLIQRMKYIDSEASEIVELPRLNVQDKVSIQLIFLSKFQGITHEMQLRLDVEQQEDDYRFVLDFVLSKNDLLAPLLPYWEDFKLKTIQYYLEKFTGLVGIALKLTQ
ncbi:MAG: hypothetical protein M3O71_15565 [Bacteroidota bacterium]|nr:hypothetical protein [Bacteroidota bacterium]